MSRSERRAMLHRVRALVLAAVVFVGGFGLPAFDAVAYHWHQQAATAPDGLPHLQQFGTPAEHSVQCVLTHNAPAPRLVAAFAATVHTVVAAPPAGTPHPATVPSHPSRHSPDQPRAPPASIA